MKFVILALTTALGLAASAHADEPSHRLPLKLPGDAKVQIHVVRTDDKTGPGGKSQLIATYDILNDYSGGGDHRDGVAHLQSMKVEKLVVNGAPAPAGFDLKGFGSMLFLADNLAFETDSSLAPLRIKDMAGLKANNLKAVLGYMTSMGQAVPDNAKAQVTSNLDAAMDRMTPEAAADQYMPEATLLSVAHNLDLQLGKTQTVDDAVATPFGPQVEGAISISLTKWDTATDTASVTYSRRPNPEALNAFVKANVPTILQMFGLPADKMPEVTSVLKDMVFKRDTSCVYEIALSTGLVRSAHCVVENGAQYKGAGQVEVNRYDLSETPVAH